MAVSAADFQYVRQVVQDDSALSLPDGKEYLVETRLAPLVKRAGLGSVRDLVDQLRSGAPDLRQHVVEALATHETQFFRDVHPFEALREHIIPATSGRGGRRRLAMWSAAASGGQEAYSLALLMREHFPEMAGVTILATDISRPVLAQAEAGRSPSSRSTAAFRPTADQALRPGRAGLAVPRPGAQNGHVPPAQPGRAALVDAGHGRRVPAQRPDLLQHRGEVALLKRVGEILRPGGYLFLGGAETTYGLDDSYERVEVGRSICYRLKTKKGVTRGHDQH